MYRPSRWVSAALEHRIKKLQHKPGTVVLTGTDDDGKIKVCDPNSRKRSEKTWDLSDLMAQMKNLWAYSYGE